MRKWVLLAIAGMVGAYLVATRREKPVAQCRDGETMCVGKAYYMCYHGEWVMLTECSVVCGCEAEGKPPEDVGGGVSGWREERFSLY